MSMRIDNRGEQLGFIPGFDLSELVYYILSNSGYKVDKQSVLRLKCEWGERRLCYLVGKDVLFATHEEFTPLGHEEAGKIVAYVNGPIESGDLDDLKEAMASVGSVEGWLISTRTASKEIREYAEALNIDLIDGDKLAGMIFELGVLEPVEVGGQLCLRTPDGDQCFVFKSDEITVFHG